MYFWKGSGSDTKFSAALSLKQNSAIIFRKLLGTWFVYSTNFICIKKRVEGVCQISLLFTNQLPQLRTLLDMALQIFFLSPWMVARVEGCHHSTLFRLEHFRVFNDKGFAATELALDPVNDRIEELVRLYLPEASIRHFCKLQSYRGKKFVLRKI